jgi:SAM-dependent methyltransferase
MLAERSFSCAVCLFSTLGMIVGSAERRRVIDHVVRLLRPGGVFVLHVHNRWFNVWDRGGRRWLIADLFRPLLGQEPGNRTGAGGLTLHHFTRSEAEQLVQTAGLEIVEVQPVSIRGDGRLPLPGWFAWLRAYGYLLAARRPLIDLPADAAG